MALALTLAWAELALDRAGMRCNLLVLDEVGAVGMCARHFIRIPTVTCTAAPGRVHCDEGHRENTLEKYRRAGDAPYPWW